jgi:hypothetical protein
MMLYTLLGYTVTLQLPYIPSSFCNGSGLSSGLISIEKLRYRTWFEKTDPILAL